MIRMEMGEVFEVFGFVEEDRWMALGWGDPLYGVAGASLFVKKSRTGLPLLWDVWKKAVLGEFLLTSI